VKQRIAVDLNLPMMKNIVVFVICVIILFPKCLGHAGGTDNDRRIAVIDIEKTAERLEAHLRALTQAIGERSVRFPENLAKTAEYIQSFYREIGLSAHNEPYNYNGLSVANVVAEISSGSKASHRYLLGAHYDSVAGTVGADDNASAVAVQLETARNLKALADHEKLDVAVTCVSFALEEPPVYGTRYMGSRVYAQKARDANQRIDGMICLEMVGYTCSAKGCQHYPFPIMFFGYPKVGNFIGIVGNFKSARFTKALYEEFQKNRDLPVVKLSVPLNGRILPAVRLSDHASFWDKGFKAVMITDSAFYRNPHYHLSSDTMDKLDLRFMAEVVESLLLFFTSHRK
jgi:hypothetical protein